MDVDDIIYIILLFGSIGFGCVYRQIEIVDQKKWVGSGIGVLIILLTSGLHISHSLITFLVNAAIILLLPKSRSHIVSFTFSFLYLIFFRTTIYFGIPYPPGHTNMIHMIMTLKLVGLAFEVNSLPTDTSEKSAESESNFVDPTFLDIFHYTFNYMGLLAGPYYRYRTFRDFFDLPFSKNARCNEETLKKLTYIPLFAVLFLWASSNWPLSYAQSDEFHERSWLYIVWYSWPTFFIFRMRLYIGMILSECVCTMAGLGAYPNRCKSKSGLGPSVNLDDMALIAKNPTRCKVEKYDFETICNINPYETDFCTTFRSAIKNWNVCVQYWFAVNVYKRFPDKKLRTVVTMLLSAYWHGMYTGHYVCIGLASFYMVIEDVYVKLFIKDNSGSSLRIWEWVIWLMKMQAFSYLAMAFLLLSLRDVVSYYASCYYCGFIAATLMYVIGLLLLKHRKAKQNNMT